MVYSNMEEGGVMTKSYPYKLGNFIQLSKYAIVPVSDILKIIVIPDREGVDQLVIKFQDHRIFLKNIDLQKVLEWLSTHEGSLYNE